MKMPDAEKPNASKEGTPSAGDKAGTDQNDKPQTVVIDGKEVSLKEIQDGLEAKQNYDKWRADLDKRGHDLNETKRGLKTLETQLTDKLQQLQGELERLKNPPVDLDSLDPDERHKVEIKVLTKEIGGLKDTISSLQTEIKSKEEQSKEEKKIAYWQGIIDDTMAKVGKDLENDDMEDLIEKTQAKMGKIPHTEWTPDLWREKAEISLDQINRKTQRVKDNYGKNKGKKDVSLDTGGTETPKRRKVSEAGDQEERLRILAQNEGVNL